MKRTLTAALLATGIHVALLGVECKRLKQISVDRPKSRAMIMTLTLRQPQNRIQNTAVKMQEELFKKLDRPKIYPKKLKTKIPKTKALKTDKTLRQSSKKVLPTTAVEKVIESFKSLAKPKPINPEPPSKPIDQSRKAPWAIQSLRQARPLYRTNPNPRYPPMARRRGYQGTVVLEVLVDRNGSVGDLQVFKSSGYSILDRAAIDSVKKWTFEPGMRGNKNVDMWVRVPIRFELQ